jgi:hypothetical protein
MAWFTTVRLDGRPDGVPVWFLLREDDTILIYSQPAKIKLRNIGRYRAVMFGLDVTDLGRISVLTEQPSTFPDSSSRSGAGICREIRRVHRRDLRHRPLYRSLITAPTRLHGYQRAPLTGGHGILAHGNYLQ